MTRNKTRDFLAPAFYLHFVYVLEKYNFLGGIFENCVRKAGVGLLTPKLLLNIDVVESQHEVD